MGDACAVVDNAKGVIHRCAGISQNESSTKTDKETPIGHQAKDESCPKVVDTYWRGVAYDVKLTHPPVRLDCETLKATEESSSAEDQENLRTL